MTLAKTTFLVVFIASAMLLSAPARVSAAAAPANATAPATSAKATASAKASAAPANRTKSGNATKVANSAHGVATARLSKGAGEGKNSTCAYYGNYNANPYFGKGLTAKIPDALFSKRCGACFKVICSNDTKRCRSGKATVTVRVVGATKTEGKQLSLSAVSWAKIVQGSDAAPVNITYKRTNCVSTAGSAVRVRSNSTAEHFNIQMVGLAGPGTLTEVELSADGKKWVKLTRDGNKAIWGIAGKEAKDVVGAKKAMSVRLTAGHTKEKITLANVIPAAWKPQTLYSSKTNFKKLMAEANRSVRRLPLAGDVALARARGARERVGLAGAVAVEVEAAEGVGVAVEEVVGVGVLVAAVVAEAASAAAVLVGVAAVEEVEEVEEEVVEVVG
ncbi:unnamed protein product [Closterium sp. NIES-64]|nr:unnamed protein product [Closterium sp. NIES-64]